jgi:tetratricopeptide (TPR) repeat protein
MEQLLMQRGDQAGLDRLHRDELLAPCAHPGDFARRSFRFLALNRNEEAEAAADAGLQIDPQNCELRFNKALAAMRLGDEERAGREFARVEKTAPNVYADALRMRAILHLRHGDGAAALPLLRERIALLGDDLDAIVEGGRMLLAGQARGEARALLEEHIALDRRIALELASVLLQDGDIAAAGRIAAGSLT